MTSAALRFQVPDIKCSSCAFKVEDSLSGLAGVKRTRTNVADKRLVVDIDQSAISSSEIVETLAAIGFEATPTANVDSREEISRSHLLARMGIAGIGMMQVMMFALAEYVAGSGGIEPNYQRLMHLASFIIATPIALYSAWPFHVGALTDLKHQRLGMDVPVSLAIAAAYGLSIFHLWRGGNVYFDSVCMFTFFLLIGRYLEYQSRAQYERSVTFAERCLPRSAVDVLGNPLDMDEVEVGTEVLVMPGEMVSVDGLVIEGSSHVSESAFSGESQPINKTIGTRVLAGSVNLENHIKVRCESSPDDFVIAKLAELHQEAMLYKPEFARFADKIARYFIATILCLSAVSGLFWWQMGREDWFVVSITVLVASCPCALSLATPVAYTIAVTTLKRLGIVVSAGKFLEQLADIDHLIFDKTGTLTEGRVRVSRVCALRDGWTDEQILAHCTALEANSKHPIARAFDGVTELVAEDLENISGEGVSGVINGTGFFLGKSTEEAPESFGTWVMLSDSDPIAWICLSDDMRADAKVVVQQLGEQSTVSLLSGDRQTEVQRIGRELGIKHCLGDQSPEAKLDYVRQCQALGERVLMIGDGVNDAAAMGAANAAIAVSPVDILVQEAADATLLRQDIGRLLVLIRYSKRLRSIVRGNIYWAVSYNLSVIPLAMVGILEPWMAALGMSLSSLLVVANANRLLRVGDH